MKKYKSKIISAIAILIIIVSVLPLIYYFRFAVLGGDDFLYGRETFHTLQDGGSYFDALKIAFKETADTYMHWQGTFFSVFLMYFHPGIFSLSLYRTVLLILFLLSIASPCIAAFTLNKYYLKAPKEYIWVILASYIFVVTQYMPSIYQAYYWYNSTIYYQFTFSISLLFVAAFVKYRNCKKKPARIFLIVSLFIMGVMIGGSNFPLGLVMALAAVIYIIASYIKKLEKRTMDTIILGFFISVFLLNVLAPGNGSRQAAHSLSPGLFSAAFDSVRDMLIETPIWLKSTITMGIVCALLPLSKKITENSNLKFIHPLIAGGIISILLLTQYFPVEYGLGSKGPARVENLRFMFLNIGIWLFFINMFGYYKDKEIPIGKTLAVVLSVIVLTISLSEIGINKFSSYKMADQITNGELTQFSQIISAEIAQFEDTQCDEPIYAGEHITNEFLHPDITFWFHSGIWDYYRKVPKKN